MAPGLEPCPDRPLTEAQPIKEIMIYLGCSASYPGIIAAAAMNFPSVPVIANALRLRRARWT
jgi:cation transport ATPase